VPNWNEVALVEIERGKKRAKVAAVYDAVAAVQADPETLAYFTHAARAEMNRVANRCDRVLITIDAEAGEG
jgi:hypothetical protein